MDLADILCHTLFYNLMHDAGTLTEEATLTFVDLAGSERLSRSGSAGLSLSLSLSLYLSFSLFLSLFLSLSL